jgi:signal transduction histidine kinase
MFKKPPNSTKKGLSGNTTMLQAVTDAGLFARQGFMTRMRMYLYMALTVYAASTVFSWSMNLPYSALITMVGMILLLCVWRLFRKQRLNLGFVILAFTVNLTVLGISLMEGLNSGVYLFFFTTTISLVVLLDYTQRRNLAITFLLSVICFAGTIFFIPGDSLFQSVSAEKARANYHFNLFISFAAVCWMGYFLARENHQRQQVMVDNQQFLNALFNSSIYADFIVDVADGAIHGSNPFARSLFAMDERVHVSGHDIALLFPQLGDAHKRQICTPGEAWEGETTCRRFDGSHFPGLVSVSPFVYEKKHYKKLTVTNITERQRMIEELRHTTQQAETLAQAKSQFLSNMSHELRTPLNGIIGTTHLLLQDESLPEQRESFQVLKYSSEYMLHLINDILDLSKLEADKIELEQEPIVLTTFIKKTTAPFLTQYKTKGIELVCDVDEQLRHPLLADATRLGQILTNLLSNALKFTTQGRVTVALQLVRRNNNLRTVLFSVSDTGIGIDEAQQQTIFEPFTQADAKTTRKYGGTGLGLTISRRLAGLMGGELKLTSAVHEGSRFYFEISLPIAEAFQEHVLQAVTTQPQQQLPHLKVLIAEDNPVNMMVAARFLDKWGIQYHKAGNGVEAVSLFAQHKYDLVLLDLEMPEMDGYNALQRIRSVNRQIPAIAFTAAVFDNMKEKLIGSGFSDYIQKPFLPNDLYQKLQAWAAPVTG